MRYVRVENGRVYEDFGTWKPPYPDVLEAPDEVYPGWLYDGSKFSPPPSEPKETK